MNAKVNLRLVPTPAQLEAQRHAAANAGAQVLGLKWYRQYPGDNLSVSRGWAAAALGLYHSLRDLQWDCAALPAEPEDIRRLGGFQTRDWRSAWPALAEHFPLCADGRRRNAALAKQRHEAIGKRWQQIDAINIRHHGHSWYRGKTADDYLTGVRTDVPSDELTHQHQHQHQLKNAYDGGTEPLRSEEVGSFSGGVRL